MSRNDISERVRTYLVDEFGLSKDLSDNDELFSTGVLDSMDILSLLTFFDKEFDIRFSSFEVGLEQLDTIELIVNAIIGKK